MIACGKEDIKSSDIGMSTVINDGKSMFKQGINVLKKDPVDKIDKVKAAIIEEQQLNVQNEVKKEKAVDYDNMYNNDLYFCLDFKNLWKFIRDCGLITPDFSLAMIDRICFQNIDNYI